MVATLNGHAPAMAAPFFIPERYEWIACDLPGYPGLVVEIRTNLRNFEIADLRLARRGVNDKRVTEMVAPWIRDWNLYEAGEDGEPVKVPPPAEADEASFRSFLRLDADLTVWLLDTLENGYKGGKGSSDASSTSETSPEPTSEPRTDAPAATPKRSSRRSPATSSGPGA